MALGASQVVKVHGLAELEQSLREIPIELERNLVRTALRDGGRVLAQGISRRMPRRTGAAAANVEISIRKDAKYGLKAVIGWSSKYFYARFLEFGTKYITRRAFMQATLEQDFQIATAAFTVSLRDRFEATVRRIARARARSAASSVD